MLTDVLLANRLIFDPLSPDNNLCMTARSRVKKDKERSTFEKESDTI